MVAKLFKVVFGAPTDSAPTEIYVAASDSMTAFDYANSPAVSSLHEGKDFLGIFVVADVLVPGTITDFE